MNLGWDSGGVAAIVPDHENGPAEPIARSDLVLSRANTDGRNRVSA